MPASSAQNSSTPLVQIVNDKPDLRKKEPPLINLTVTNPVTYLKSWWKKVMGQEGIDVRFKIHPLTAMVLTIIIATFGFGVGRFTLMAEKPFIKYVPLTSPTPLPSPDPWRETAFSGLLQKSNNNYYLITTAAEAILLEVPKNVDLKNLIGRRILATGRYNEHTLNLIVSEAADLEVLPKRVETVPVVTPSPAATSSGSR